MNSKKLIFTLFGVIAVAMLGVYAVPRLFRPPPSTERSVEQQNIKRQAPGTEFSKPSDAALRKTLTELQYYVTQENGTERAGRNEYWNKYEDGIYVDIVSGEPLFSSKDKFKSGTGWPSFTRPLDKDEIVEKADGRRVEIRSKTADSHLGHVFDDGPAPTGKRYCMNSAAMRFVPKEKLEELGYVEYKKLFE